MIWRTRRKAADIAVQPRFSAGSPATRRRWIVGLVSVTGSGILGRSLSTKPDSAQFYRLTTAAAATWTVGGLVAQPPHSGARRRAQTPLRSVATPILFGVGAFGVFYGCALLARRVPTLNDAISTVLRFADNGSTSGVLLITLANGAAEEVFFRGGVYAATGSHPVLISTAVYCVTTAVATRNPALVLASVTMGTLFALQRRATGGIQAPLLTHLTWSTLMVRFLPRLFRVAE
jgi:uncharacterized protein